MGLKMKRSIPEKFLDGVAQVVLVPFYFWHICLWFGDRFQELHREAADRAYLKRINMTLEEFRILQEYFRHKHDNFKGLLDRLQSAEDAVHQIVHMSPEYTRVTAARHIRLYKDFPYRTPEVESGKGKSYKTQVSEQLQSVQKK